MTVEDTVGCRILVVEDEMLIAFQIEATLEALGCTIAGPVSTLESAVQMAKDPALDAAILDVTVRGGKTYAVAEDLLNREIPFVLASGYGDWTLPDSLRDKLRLIKPFTTAELERQAISLCNEVARRRRTVAPAAASKSSR